MTAINYFRERISTYDSTYDDEIKIKKAVSAFEETLLLLFFFMLRVISSDVKYFRMIYFFMSSLTFHFKRQEAKRKTSRDSLTKAQ
jgi:hypothetical protein